MWVKREKVLTEVFLVKLEAFWSSYFFQIHLDIGIYWPDPLLEKCPNTELFLARIFLYSDWIRRFTTEFFLFYCIRTKYGHLLRKSP